MFLGFFNKQVEQQYQQYRESQFYNPDKLEKIQEEKLESLLRHAASHVPFYRNILNKEDLSKASSLDYLFKIPILTRKILQDFHCEFISDKNTASSMHLHSSGGTTGEPVRYYLDNQLKKLCRAIERRGDYEWTGTLSSSRKVLLWGRVHVSARSLHLVRGFLNKQWKYYLYSATEKDVARVIRHIKLIRPHIIMGYSSFIGRIAQYMEDNDITTIRPRAIISTAELLTQETRDLAQRMFGCRVYNRYASGEFGLIASECPIGSMHIHSERVLVEVVQNNMSVPPGTEGEIVITDLDNYAFPLIRYATGDVGVISKSLCACGRGLPVLKRLSGRTTDYIQTPMGGSVLASETFTAFRVVCAKQEIRQVQIIQPSLDTIIARVVPGEDYTKNLEGEIRRLLFDLCFCDTGVRHIEFEYMNELETAASGKTPYYISLLHSKNEEIK